MFPARQETGVALGEPHHRVGLFLGSPVGAVRGSSLVDEGYPVKRETKEE